MFHKKLPELMNFGKFYLSLMTSKITKAEEF